MLDGWLRIITGKKTTALESRILKAGHMMNDGYEMDRLESSLVTLKGNHKILWDQSTKGY